MKLSKEHIERLREMLARPGQRIVVVSHTNPDGDAVGSSLAWAEVLRTMGHAVTCVVPNKYPYFLDWMPGIDEVVIFKTDTEGRARRAIAEADMIFCLDFNAVSRLEILSDTIAANTTARRVLIDHHLSPDEGFDLMFSHPDSSSTCFLVYSIVEAMCGAGAITRRMAESLYVGMMTDTGGFAYNSSSPEIYFIISELLTKGFDKDKVYRNVFNNYSKSRVRLTGYVLYNKLHFYPKLRACYYTLTGEEMRRFNFQRGDTEGLVNMPLVVKGMRLSIALREDTEGGKIRVSLRSVDDFPCNKMAAEFFNGGGHLNASGGELRCTMDEAVETVNHAVEAYAKLL